MNVTIQPQKLRSQWIDITKGITITLVTLHHVVTGLWAAGLLPASIYSAYALGETVRMPLFFLVAGFFAQKAVRLPWRTFLDSKVVHFMYFYLIWNLISMLTRWALSPFTNSDVVPADLLLIGWKPIEMLWFLYVLSLGFLYIRLLDRIGPVYQTALAGMLLGVSFAIPSDIEVPQMFCRMLLFFVIGTHASELIRRTVTARARLLLPLGTAVFLMLALLIAQQGKPLMHVPLVFFVSATGASFAIMAMAHLISGTMVGNLFNTIGQYSLFIYVMNFLPTAGVRVPMRMIGLTDYPILAILVGTAFSVAFCILVYKLVVRTPLRFVFVRPSWLGLSAGSVAAD